jgi:hypothetical protein
MTPRQRTQREQEDMDYRFLVTLGGERHLA